MLCFYNMRPVEGARGPAQFHVTAGKTRANKGRLTWIQGCKRRVSDMDPSCSAGIYLRMNREDSKYQHPSQCTPFLSLQLILETHRRGSAALCAPASGPLQWPLFAFTDFLKCHISWDEMIFTRFHKHSSCKSHLKIQNLCWRMIREAVLVCVIASVGTRSPRTTIQPAFLSYEAENGFHHGPWNAIFTWWVKNPRGITTLEVWTSMSLVSRICSF